MELKTTKKTAAAILSKLLQLVAWSNLYFIDRYTPVTLEAEWARMPSEWKFVVHSWIFEVHSKNSDCIPNIRAHSCDRPECFYHAKIIRLRRRIETASHFKSCQNVPNAPRMNRKAPRMHFDYCRNLFRLYKNSAGMQFKCRRNLSIAARIQSERPDWPSNESGRNSEHRRIAYLGIY